MRRAAWVWGMLLAAALAAPAQADKPPAPPPAASFVAPDFAVPTLVETPGFKLVPLGPALVDIDYAAYTSSIAHLQQSFTRSTSWPREGITDAEAMADMENEAARFESRRSFAYAVLTPDGMRERGCIYVAPSPVSGYNAVVHLWVTQAEYDAGFDAELYAWARGWMASTWPFASVAFPGRAIAWEEWDTLNKASPQL